jgi:hypothetical protein
MSLLPSTHNNGLNKLRGKAKFAPRNADGSTQALMNLSPTAELAYTVTTESSTYESQEDAVITTLDSQVDKISHVFTFTINQLTDGIRAMFTLGDVSEITQATGSVTAEVSPYVFANRSIQLGGTLNSGAGVFGASAETISSYEGVNAATWLTVTPYALGAVAIPSTPNLHWYMATTGGTAAASEPTWPTDGSTVTDGTVTWQDMGLIVYVADTDYELDADNAFLNIPDTGAIATAVALVPASLRAAGTTFRLSSDYTRAAKTFNQIAAGTSDSKEGEFRFYSANAEGDDQNWYVPSAKVTPNGDLSLHSGTDYGAMSFTVTAIKLPTKSAIYVNGRPA